MNREATAGSKGTLVRQSYACLAVNVVSTISISSVRLVTKESEFAYCRSLLCHHILLVELLEHWMLERLRAPVQRRLRLKRWPEAEE